jgi:hypothetical protein
MGEDFERGEHALELFHPSFLRQGTSSSCNCTVAGAFPLRTRTVRREVGLSLGLTVPPGFSRTPRPGCSHVPMCLSTLRCARLNDRLFAAHCRQTYRAPRVPRNLSTQVTKPLFPFFARSHSFRSKPKSRSRLPGRSLGHRLDLGIVTGWCIRGSRPCGGRQEP